MRRLGPWLLLAMLAAAQEPERLLTPNSTAAFQLPGEASATFRVDVPEGSVVHLMLHEERGIAGKFTVRDSTSAAQIDVHKGVDPALVAKEKRGEDLLDARHERLLLLLEEPHTPAREAAARRNVEGALDAYQKVQVEIRIKSPEYAAITQRRLLKLSDIQALLPTRGTAFAEFWLGEPKSFAWLVSITGCRTFDLPSRRTLESAARRIHEAVSARNVEITETLETQQQRLQEAGAEYSRSAAALARMLAGLFGGLASSQRWWVVTDGALDYVPLAALRIRERLYACVTRGRDES